MRIKATSFGSLEIGDSSACPGGEHATIRGTATVNGTPGHELRIEADDCDGLPSGNAPDRFEIHVDDGSPTATAPAACSPAATSRSTSRRRERSRADTSRPARDDARSAPGAQRSARAR